jgi:endonuclease YncB( thermonuclease family)
MRSELALADRATERLIELVNQGPFEIQAWPGRDTDGYGRALRVLVRNGLILGDILVSEGLARTWTGRREPRCWTARPAKAEPVGAHSRRSHWQRSVCRLP